MDLVVRRQSEQLDRHFADAHNDIADKSHGNDVYDHRKWEWGHLRVGVLMSACCSTILSFNPFKLLDGMPEFRIRDILQNVRTAIAAQLFISIFCNAYDYWGRPHDCFGCNANGKCSSINHRRFVTQTVSSLYRATHP